MAAQDTIDALTASVSKTTTVEKSAEVLINGFQARLDKGIADALAGGATEAQVASLKTLSTDLDTESDSLAAAVAANTPAA